MVFRKESFGEAFGVLVAAQGDRFPLSFLLGICWANENWSKLWDGGNQEIILKQELKEVDAESFFNDMLPYFQDSRYEKIDNRPILMIYRPSLFSRNVFLHFVETLNKLAKDYGFDGMYIYASNSYGFNEPTEYGCNGLIEFPPHGLWEHCQEIRTIDRLIPDTDFKVGDTSDFIEKKLYLTKTDYPVYKCCFPSGDNTPRKAWSKGWCFDLTDSGFFIWLTDILKWTKDNHALDEQYVYINAWNEWGEGAILEPTLRYGYKSLSIVKQCLESIREK